GQGREAGAGHDRLRPGVPARRDRQHGQADGGHEQVDLQGPRPRVASPEREKEDDPGEHPQRFERGCREQGELAIPRADRHGEGPDRLGRQHADEQAGCQPVGATRQRQGGKGGEAGRGDAEAELAEVRLGHSTQFEEDASSLLRVRNTDNELAHIAGRAGPYPGRPSVPGPPSAGSEGSWPKYRRIASNKAGKSSRRRQGSLKKASPATAKNS